MPLINIELSRSETTHIRDLSWHPFFGHISVDWRICDPLHTDRWLFLQRVVVGATSYGHRHRNELRWTEGHAHVLPVAIFTIRYLDRPLGNIKLTPLKLYKFL
mgnify:CR=1 FL=1